MTREEHDEYSRKIDELQELVQSARFEDLTLTDEEAEALESADAKYTALIEEELSRYIPPRPEYDFTRALVNKAVARYLIDVLPVAERSYRMGVETVL